MTALFLAFVLVRIVNNTGSVCSVLDVGSSRYDVSAGAVRIVDCQIPVVFQLVDADSFLVGSVFLLEPKVGALDSAGSTSFYLDVARELDIHRTDWGRPVTLPDENRLGSWELLLGGIAVGLLVGLKARVARRTGVSP